MLKIPVYARNGIYYIHTRINKLQVKKSLNTRDRTVAIIRALELMKAIDMTIDPSKIKKYEIDIERGIFKSNGTEDHRNMLEAISKVENIGVFRKKPAPQPPEGEHLKEPISLRLPEILEKFLSLKKQLTPATAIAYKKAINEFSGFTGNQFIVDYDKSDISRYMEHLSNFNEPRTIDGKVGVLHTIFSFAIKQGYYFKENPAANRKLMSKRDRAKNGYPPSH